MFALVKGRSLRILFVTIFFGIHILMSAQSPVLTLKTNPEIVAANETLITVIASITNASTNPFSGTLEITSDAYLKRINQGPIAISLEAGEAIFLPIKIWVDKQQPAGNSAVVFRILDPQGVAIEQSNTLVNIALKRQLRILADESQLMMRQIGDSIRVNTRIYNNGNQKESIKLLATFPQLTYQNTLLHKEIELKPFSDTIVTFSKIIDRELLALEYFTVNVAALDLNNDFIGNAITTVQNALGERRYINPNQNTTLNNYWNNRISIQARDIFGNNPAYNFLARKELELSSGKLALSVDATRWENSSLDPLFTNTWLQYEQQGKGIQIGNIQENGLEINLTGRGIKVYTNNDENEKKTELGFIEKSYNLIGKSNWDTNDIAAFAKNKFRLSEKTSLNSSLIYDKNYGIDSYLLMNNLYWRANNNWKYDFKFAQGLSGANQKDYRLPYKSSMALGANISGKIGDYQINSSNFYSSGYYPGIRKGAILLDERISKRFNKNIVWFAFNYYNYNPDFIDPLIYYKNNSENIRTEMGIAFSLRQSLRLTLVPQLNFENGQYITSNSSEYQVLKYQSTVLAEALNWTSKNHSHNINLSLSQGLAQYPLATEKEFIYKAEVSWTYGGFQINSFYQQGNFMLTEGLFNSFSTSEKMERLSLTPSYTKSFWNEKLSLQLSGMYNYDTFSGKSYVLSGTSEWKAFKQTSLFVSYNQYYYQNENFQSQNTFIQAGITQLLAGNPIGYSTKKGTIRLFCYYDRNTNGIYDDGDEPAANRIVMINESAFVTQKDGTVKYKGVPYGAYHISLQGKNWMAEEYDENLVSKNLQRSIPLQETGNLRGKFEYVVSQNLQYEVTGNRSGLGVILKNQQGKVFNFKTNDQGEFLAYLPLGTYEMTVDHSLLPKNVYTEETSRKLVVSKGNSQIIEPIILKVKERKVDIKRFGK